MRKSREGKHEEEKGAQLRASPFDGLEGLMSEKRLKVRQRETDLGEEKRAIEVR